MRYQSLVHLRLLDPGQTLPPATEQIEPHLHHLDDLKALENPFRSDRGSAYGTVLLRAGRQCLLFASLQGHCHTWGLPFGSIDSPIAPIPA